MSPKRDTRTVIFLVDSVGHDGEPIQFSHLNEATAFAGVMARRGSTAKVSVVSLDQHGATFGPVMALSTHGPAMMGSVMTGTLN